MAAAAAAAADAEFAAQRPDPEGQAEEFGPDNPPPLFSCLDVPPPPGVYRLEDPSCTSWRVSADTEGGRGSGSNC